MPYEKQVEVVDRAVISSRKTSRTVQYQFYPLTSVCSARGVRLRLCTVYILANQRVCTYVSAICPRGRVSMTFWACSWTVQGIIIVILWSCVSLSEDIQDYLVQTNRPQKENPLSPNF